MRHPSNSGFRKRLMAELLVQFPWLEEDEEVSGADVVEQLCNWYHELKAEEAKPE